MKLRILAGILIAGMLTGIWWPNPALPFGGAPELWKDALHTPFFAIFSLLIFTLTSSRRKISSRILITVVVALILSPVTEAVQPLFNRNASLGDLFANTIGILVAGSGLWIYRARKSGLGLKVFHTVASILLALSFLTPTILKAQASKWLASSFPELSNFTDQRASFFWVSQGQAALTLESGALRISTKAGEWSGVNFFPGSEDWSGRNALVLEFDNPGDAFQLGTRIDDDGDCSSHSSRFNGSLEIPRGPSTHRIPLDQIAAAPDNRPLNLSAITRLALFVGPDEPPRVFFLKGAFLE